MVGTERDISREYATGDLRRTGGSDLTPRPWAGGKTRSPALAPTLARYELPPRVCTPGQRSSIRSIGEVDSWMRVGGVPVGHLLNVWQKPAGIRGCRVGPGSPSGWYSSTAAPRSPRAFSQGGGQGRGHGQLQLLVLIAVTVDERAPSLRPKAQALEVRGGTWMLRPRRRANVRLDTRRGSYRLGLPLCWIQAGTSVPVELHGGPIGSLDLYSARPRDWDDSEIGAQQAYAGIAASSAAATHLKGRLADQPQAALAHGAVIGQANGVLMERERLDAPTAYERLRAAARSSSRKVADVARELLAGVPLPPNEPIVGGAAPHRGGWPGDQGGSHIRPGVSA